MKYKGKNGKNKGKRRQKKSKGTKAHKKRQSQENSAAKKGMESARFFKSCICFGKSCAAYSSAFSTGTQSAIS